MSTPTDPSASTSTPASNTATVFQRLHPRVYFEKFVAEGVRPDGRDFTEWRDVSVNVGSISTANGSSLARIGQTTIVCGVKAELAAPDLASPTHGFLVPNLDLPAISSPKFKPGPPGEEAQVLSERLNEALSATLDLETLCIEKGKVAWVLYVDAVCINYDGNVFDAALLAMVAALDDVTLPKAYYDEDSGKTICATEDGTPLTLHRKPVSMTFGLFDRTHLLTDPTSFEEPLLETTLSIVLDISPLNAEHLPVVSVTHTGAGITSEVQTRCTELSRSRASWMKSHLKL